MSKQKVLQIVVGLFAFAGFLVSLAPLIDVIPASYQKYGMATVAFALALEKFLVSINQILVGPTKLQSAAVQEKLSNLPDKSDGFENPDAPVTSNSIDNTNPVAPTITHP